jgi:hypothetical protein
MPMRTFSLVETCQNENPLPRKWLSTPHLPLNTHTNSTLHFCYHVVTLAQPSICVCVCVCVCVCTRCYTPEDGNLEMWPWCTLPCSSLPRFWILHSFGNYCLEVHARCTSAVHINTLQLLTLFVGTLLYLGAGLFFLIVFSNDALSAITV